MNHEQELKRQRIKSIVEQQHDMPKWSPPWLTIFVSLAVMASLMATGYGIAVLID